jgi:hypothetical protein
MLRGEMFMSDAICLSGLRLPTACITASQSTVDAAYAQGIPTEKAKIAPSATDVAAIANFFIGSNPLG